MVARTIFLVRDNDSLAKYSTQLAEIPDCSIAETTNPFKASHMTANAVPGPDLVITNYSFEYYKKISSHQMTGPGLVRAVRNTGSRAKFVLCGPDDASAVNPDLEQLRTGGTRVEYFRVDNDTQQDDHQQGLADLVMSMLGG